MYIAVHYLVHMYVDVCICTIQYTGILVPNVNSEYKVVLLLCRRDCLKQTIQFSTEAEVKCPFSDGNYSCDSVIQEREIKAVRNKKPTLKHDIFFSYFYRKRNT